MNNCRVSKYWRNEFHFLITILCIFSIHRYVWEKGGMQCLGIPKEIMVWKTEHNNKKEGAKKCLMIFKRHECMVPKLMKTGWCCKVFGIATKSNGASYRSMTVKNTHQSDEVWSALLAPLKKLVLPCDFGPYLWNQYFWHREILSHACTNLPKTIRLYNMLKFL